MDSVAVSEAVDVGSIPAACTSFQNPVSSAETGFFVPFSSEDRFSRFNGVNFILLVFEPLKCSSLQA